MIISIDVYNNKVVRLYKGSLDFITYFGYLYEYIDFYSKINIKKIHIVFLDNIFKKKYTNFSLNKNIKIQIGGNINDIKVINFYSKKNVKKFVLSSILIEKFKFKKIFSYYKKRILIGIDCYKNYFYINGWKTNTKIEFYKIYNYIINIGIKSIIYTNIENDGTLKGVKLNIKNIKNYINLSKLTISGGISDEKNALFIKYNYNCNIILGISIYKFLIKISLLC